MKRPSRQHIQTFLEKYWPLLVGAILFIVGVAGLVISTNAHTTPHETGVLPSSRAVQQQSKLSDTTGQPEAHIKSAAPSSCADNTSGKLLLVSISQQHIWACDGTSVANESAVTTGASALTNVDDATPIGTWHIYSKTRSTTLKGCDVNGCWNDPVQYWMPYDGSVGFHDASWQTFPFGGPEYTTEGSHGCVHLPADMAAWVYGWAPIGTTVTVKS